MPLHAGEPLVGQWQVVDEADLSALVRSLLPGSASPSERGLVLIDGGSGSGKSTLAGRLARAMTAALVHTDDLSWQAHPLDWDDALVEGVLQPWRRGEPVAFRPQSWIAASRPGAVTVPADAQLLVVEGVGAGRAGLAALAEVVVWVQTDRAVARGRGLIRDIALGRDEVEATRVWDLWEGHELPHFAADRPWQRAHLIVDGAPPTGLPAGCLRVHRGHLKAGTPAEPDLE